MEDKVKSFWKLPTRKNALLIGIAVSVLTSVSASGAGITISVDSVAAGPGSSMNSFDVDLVNLGLSTFTIGGFNFGLSVANPNISLTGVTYSTGVNYIFSGNSLFGPDLSGPNSGQTISASDVVLSPSTGTTISSGETVGLGHVFFDVSRIATPGIFAVNLAAFPSTSISNALGKDLHIDALSPGHITITGPTPAPEPSSLFLLLLSGAAVILGRPLSQRPES